MPFPLANTLAMGQGTDLVAPTISITAPTTGTYATRTITCTASASDDRAVVGVQYQINGVNAGAEVTSGGTWTLNLDTTAYADGDYTLTAIARDAVGHKTTSAGVTLHIANPNTATVHALQTWNGVGSGSRRSYGSTGSFASPNYHDSPGSVTWPGNPYANWGYIIQVRLVTSVDSFGHGYESINGISGDHATAINISGTGQVGSTFTDATGGVGAWATAPNAASTVQLNDWLTNAGGIGGTAYTGDITLQYRYQ